MSKERILVKAKPNKDYTKTISSTSPAVRMKMMSEKVEAKACSKLLKHFDQIKTDADQTVGAKELTAYFEKK